MFSQVRMGRSQAGQWDPGQAMDRPAGTRWITTLRKEPTSSPKTSPKPPSIAGPNSTPDDTKSSPISLHIPSELATDRVEEILR